MHAIAEWLRRIEYRICRRRNERELREEIDAHRAQMGEPERFGNALRLREESADVWGWNRFDAILRDVRHGWRSLARMPLTVGVIVVSLGAAIGVNTAVYSWIDAIVFNPIPGVRDDSGVYLIEPRSELGAYLGTSWLEYRDLGERLGSFRGLAAFRMASFTVGPPEANERSWGLLVSDNYFSELGLEPALGRFPQDGKATLIGNDQGAVISNGFWQRRFNGSEDVVGQQLEVNGRLMDVIGVTPPGFYGTVLSLDFDIWVPAGMAAVLFPQSRELEVREQRGYDVLGRLRPGASARTAQEELDRVMGELAATYPGANARVTAEVLPFWRASRGPQRMLLASVVVLQVLMLLLLTAVSVNAANLLLARASTRGREIAVRLAIGAGRWRIVRLLMIENVLVALAASGLGVAIAVWGTNALRAVPLPTMFPIRLDTHVDAGGLAVALGLGLASAIGFGVAPALGLIRSDHISMPRSQTSSTRPGRSQNLLVGAEAAVALAVLVAAGLFLGGFRETQTIDPGFDSEGVLLAGYDLSGGGAHLSGGNADEEIKLSFAVRVLERLRGLPEVEAAAIAMAVPLDIHGLPFRGFVLEGGVQTEVTPDQALMNIVTSDYFETMGIGLVEGADFSDTRTRSEAVVNEAFVRRYSGGAPIVGRTIETGGVDGVIVGVVADSVYQAFDEVPIPIIYRAFATNPLGSAQIHLKTRPGAETLLVPEVRRIVRDIEPALPLFDIRTLAQHVDTNLFLERIPARIFALLGPMLLVLVGVGFYAVVAFTVSRRTREIGIRLAIGARPGTVMAQIMIPTLTVILLGAGVGWLMVWLLQSHLAPGQPLDRPAFLGVPVLLMSVAALACWLPARRGARIDPIESLRDD